MSKRRPTSVAQIYAKLEREEKYKGKTAFCKRTKKHCDKDIPLDTSPTKTQK